MKRREFIALLAGGPVACFSPSARSQPIAPTIGFIHSGSEAAYSHLLGAFRQGLKDGGYLEGRNVTIEYRWAEGQPTRLPAMVADLVARGVNVIVSTGGPAPVLAAKAATSTIPIVFSTGADPIRLGLVASLNRPGGNITGVNVFTAVMASKRLALLHELVPAARSIAVLLNPDNPTTAAQFDDVQAAARTLGQKINVRYAASDADFEAAFQNYERSQDGALLVGADPFFVDRRQSLIAFASRHAAPAFYEQREFPLAGGLASYGTSLVDAYRQVGLTTARVLNGEAPADLPVIQSTKFEFVINLKTANALGLAISPMLLARADEVIE